MSQGPLPPPRGTSPVLVVALIVAVLVVVGGGAFLLLTDDDDSDTLAEADSEDGNIATGGQARPDFEELDKIQPPGLEDLDLDDIEPPDLDDDLDIDIDDDLDIDDGSGTGSEAEAGPPDEPPTGGDSTEEALAQDCYDGVMAACDRLFFDTTNSDFRDYGDTCGGRLDTSALPNCITVLGD